MSSLLSWVSHLYLFAAILYIVHFLHASARLAQIALLTLGIGFLAHAVVVAQGFAQHGFTPVSSLGEALSFFGWLLAGLFLWTQLRFRLPVLGAFAGPFLVATVLPAVLMRGEAQALPEQIKMAGMPFHVTVAFAGIAAFALASGIAVAYLVLERQMKRKRFGVLFSRLPSLEVLDALAARLTRWGFVALSVTMMTGAYFAKRAWGDYWVWDPKLTVSLIGWLLFAALLSARIFAGWRGRRAAVLTTCGFLVLFGSFLWFQVFPAGLHGGDFQ
jgi:cytochrome c-type biogenesis protein CcsB